LFGLANKKPLGDFFFLFKHAVETIFVSTGWANLKFVIHLNSFNFVIHAILPVVEI